MQSGSLFGPGLAKLRTATDDPGRTRTFGGYNAAQMNALSGPVLLLLLSWFPVRAGEAWMLIETCRHFSTHQGRLVAPRAGDPGV